MSADKTADVIGLAATKAAGDAADGVYELEYFLSDKVAQMVLMYEILCELREIKKELKAQARPEQVR